MRNECDDYVRTENGPATHTGLVMEEVDCSEKRQWKKAGRITEQWDVLPPPLLVLSRAASHSHVQLLWRPHQISPRNGESEWGWIEMMRGLFWRWEGCWGVDEVWERISPYMFVYGCVWVSFMWSSQKHTSWTYTFVVVHSSKHAVASRQLFWVGMLKLKSGRLSAVVSCHTGRQRRCRRMGARMAVRDNYV